MRAGINGIGRISRLALRAALGGAFRDDDGPRARNRLEVGHANEIKGAAAATAHLREFGSVHGRWRERIVAEDDRCHGQITTIHDPTGANVVVDAPREDPRRARSAMLSLQPTTTAAMLAACLALTFLPPSGAEARRVPVRRPRRATPTHPGRPR